MGFVVKVVVTVAAFSTLIFGGGFAANAVPVLQPEVASTQTLVADGPQVEQGTKALESRLANLQDGESFLWTAPAGEKIIFTNAEGIVNVTGPLVFGPQANAVGEACVLANTVAIGIFVLGAAAIAVLAFVTAGAGGAVVGGVFLSTSQLGLAAGVAGSFGGVLAWTSSFLC